ncbi:MAG: polysaccharide deacetylase family protein [Thermoleophilaceae bacterium]|nr:polysaccharide deacetylase family protein [Thermoleophilaceae bacterium]
MSTVALAPLRGPLENRSGAAAMLCWHSIGRVGPPYLTVPPELFDRQLATLSSLGWESGDRDDLAALAAGVRPLRPKVFLTFDDGFADNHDAALPLLREHGFKAFVFVLPRHLDTGAPLAWKEVAESARRHPEVMRSLTWSQVERMAEAGVEIGSHTLTHARLTELGDEELREELLASRRAIVERLGRCDTIAYPFGDWDARVVRAAADAGYRFGFTMPRGAQLTTTTLSIPRVAVDDRDTPRRLRLRLTPAYRRLLLSPVRDLVRTVRARGGRR